MEIDDLLRIWWLGMMVERGIRISLSSFRGIFHYVMVSFLNAAFGEEFRRNSRRRISATKTVHLLPISHGGRDSSGDISGGSGGGDSGSDDDSWSGNEKESRLR
ncbi:hypothetical protein PIB30_050186 [Stylosanthes scabra]|uniref:Uncharacterized protein n=1 Tax=Stylosanthes scabra TaxID=79078 RepID=A0ABU6TIC4_9FABA|nr:hypothetical protein [Stylosanthes scabra]